jgi:hypothetical protein
VKEHYGETTAAPHTTSQERTKKINFNFSERLESHSRPFVNQSPRKIVYAAEKVFHSCSQRAREKKITFQFSLR